MVATSTNGNSQSQPMRVLTASATNEWYTPRRYIEAARGVMGTINLDPASNAEANQIVQAGRIYTEADYKRRGKTLQLWDGRVWCNPPYGKGPGGYSWQGVFADEFIYNYKEGWMQEGIILVNLYASYKWFGTLAELPRCEPNHLIKFINPNVPEDMERGEGTKPAKASSVFFYAGRNPERFYEVFKHFGYVGQLSRDT
jgi:hypothetical protein